MDVNNENTKDYILDSENVQPLTWDELGIKDDILRSIYKFGFEKPTPIQLMSFKPIVDGRDIVAQAQSGTGKTGAFTIACLHKINISEKITQVLILAPTRELVLQIFNVITELSSSIDNILTKYLVGGSNVSDDIQYLNKDKPHLVVGTIGRTYDMIRRNKLNVSNLKLLIMDEADELLSSGFKEQIKDLFQYLTTKTQISLFSATIPKDVISITNKMLNNPIHILVKQENLSLECIQQYYIALQNDSQKYDTLTDLYSIIQMNQSIIYANTIEKVDEIYHNLKKDNYSVVKIHSYMDKSQREDALKSFRNGSNRILISSSVTSRGIDVQQVSTVINYDIPRNIETYLHAIGRSGRYGRKGIAINFVTKYDINVMRRIEDHYKINIRELPSSFQ
jgi:superfamily II DNA/RNA helicase